MSCGHFHCLPLKEEGVQQNAAHLLLYFYFNVGTTGSTPTYASIQLLFYLYW